jgi:hypothetical protein
MKLPLIFLSLAAFAVCAYADDTNGGSGSSFLVPNGHGGYNVNQAGGPPSSIPFFGFHGYASHVVAQSQNEKPKFILKPVVIDDGHGKHVVYKKIRFATAEQAEAARLAQ